MNFFLIQHFINKGVDSMYGGVILAIPALADGDGKFAAFSKKMLKDLLRDSNETFKGSYSAMAPK